MLMKAVPLVLSSPTLNEFSIGLMQRGSDGLPVPLVAHLENSTSVSLDVLAGVRLE